MNRIEGYLERMEAEARLLRLEAVKLMEFYRSHPLLLRQALPRLEVLVDELSRLREEVYAFSARLRAPTEDNSAEALRREFL